MFSFSVYLEFILWINRHQYVFVLSFFCCCFQVIILILTLTNNSFFVCSNNNSNSNKQIKQLSKPQEDIKRGCNTFPWWFFLLIYKFKHTQYKYMFYFHMDNQFKFLWFFFSILELLKHTWVFESYLICFYINNFFFILIRI